MRMSARIALSMPNAGKAFTFRLKQEIRNEPAVFESPSKILAISDIEGNFLQMLKVLYRNKVIDKKLRWTFGDGHLVIAGDYFDRGEQVVECLWLIYSLEEKARQNGGYVHFILGNHEIMNMNGDWRYVHPKYAKSTKSSYTALFSGNNELWHWLCTKNIMEKIGRTLFVHGGISEELLKFEIPVTEINNLVRPWYSQANNNFIDPLLKAVFNGESSPFWYRGYYQSGVTEELVDATMQHFSVDTIVTGHTMMERITPIYNGKIINIDTDHATGISEALLIRKGHFYRIDTMGKREKIK